MLRYIFLVLQKSLLVNYIYCAMVWVLSIVFFESFVLHHLVLQHRETTQNVNL